MIDSSPIFPYFRRIQIIIAARQDSPACSFRPCPPGRQPLTFSRMAIGESRVRFAHGRRRVDLKIKEG